jgi:hypothetical protein
VADTTIQLSTPLSASTEYYWHVAGIDTAGAGPYSNMLVYKTGTGILAVTGQLGVPTKFELFANYPNPFNPTTVIKYNLPKAQMVTLKVYNVLGQTVATLVEARQNAGYYQVTFNGDRLASGVYFYILRTQNFTATQKMMLLK